MNSFKREIAVADVVPNDGNPRRDFGDVARLAATFDANGGQPYTPIVVVPDGDRYRLVDGERRWRAMVSLGTERCDALVFMSMGDAEAAVAMMATDDSKALSEAERLRGFQSMLALGVDDGTVASVTGTDAATVRRARRIAADAPAQATLDGLFAAADDEFSDEERAQIIAEGSRRYGDPQSAAARIRAAHEREARLAAIRDLLPDGCEVRPGTRPAQPEREGLMYVSTPRRPEAAARLAAQLEGEEGLVAYADGTGYAVFRTASEDAVDAAEAEAARVRRVRDEHRQAYAEAYREMCRWATEPWWHDDLAARHRTPASRRPNLCEAVMASRAGRFGRFDRALSEAGREVLGHAVTYAEDEDPSCLEVCEWLMGNHAGGGLLEYHGTEVSGYACTRFTEVYDALLLDGFHPSQGAVALRNMCPAGGDES